MSGRYEDIIHLPHHVSPTRQRMTPVERGAQFSPFAALVGFDRAVEETARLTQQPIELAQDSLALLNERLWLLWEKRPVCPVTVTWFRPDSRKSGGEYVTRTAHIQRIDPVEQTVVLSDGTAVPMEYIVALEGPVFADDI